ncbi:MAG TPA: sigma 54-interacting transcriptional regulator [Smithellaceae bacterium]|nr:sigma 54-interacting transcriptional regulator [Smithellaceae bacterium]
MTRVQPDASHEIKELKLLFEISRHLSDALDLRDALKPVLPLMAEYLCILRGSITILNRDTGEISIDEAYGLLPKEKARGRYKLGEGITGQVIETGREMVVPRISDEPQFLDRTGARKNLDGRFVTFMCVPIKIGLEVIGALSVDRPYLEESLCGNDVRLLTIIASCISQAARLRQLAEEEVAELRSDNRRLYDELAVKFGPQSIIGKSRPMLDVYALIDKVSKTAATVLILGESGVGKERIAQAIHYHSHQAANPYVKVNCAALPENLIESELFGHEKGSFTGATAMRKGRFEMAEGGTIFLDEIGELSLTLQAKLLRILQEKEFERVGGNVTLKANVRVIAATNRNLEALVHEGKYREDLYYRLNIFPITVPPLRERRADIALLADYFLEKYSGEIGKPVRTISDSACQLLKHHDWPGNVRELENCIERAIILTTDGGIHRHHLPSHLRKCAPGSASKNPGALGQTLEAVERDLIIEALGASAGNMAGAARALGITERVMGLRVARFGIDPKQL